MDVGSLWLQSCADSFVFYTWGMTEIMKCYNERFHLLTAQNLRIALELHNSAVMCRLGLHNNFTVIGIAVVVADCAGKLLMNMFVSNSRSVPIKNMYKSTSVGFDNVREVVDVWRTSYEDFLHGWNSADDAQLMVQVGLVFV